MNYGIILEIRHRLYYNSTFRLSWVDFLRYVKNISLFTQYYFTFSLKIQKRVLLKEVKEILKYLILCINKTENVMWIYINNYFLKWGICCKIIIEYDISSFQYFSACVSKSYLSVQKVSWSIYWKIRKNLAT